MGRDEYGECVGSMSPEARRWNLLGAINVVTKRDVVRVQILRRLILYATDMQLVRELKAEGDDAAAKTLDHCLNSPYGLRPPFLPHHISRWENKRGRTHADVLALLDFALDIDAHGGPDAQTYIC